MLRTIILSLATITAVAFTPATRAHSAEQDAKPSTQSFLKTAAEMHQAEITLGWLAAKADRGTNKRVRQFGSQMIDAHQKMNKEIQLRDLQNDVHEYEESMQTVEDADVLRWAHQTVPSFRAHVEEARSIKYALQTTPGK